MLGRGGTGVTGREAKSGKGLGNCGGAHAIRKGAGLGLGLGFRRGTPNFANPTVFITQKELLQEQKESHESRLENESTQLERQ